MGIDILRARRTGRPAALRARTVPLGGITPQDRARWAALSARAVEPNPFLDPAFLHTANAWMPKARDIQLVVVEDHGSMLGLLPMSTQPRTRRLPLAHATTAGRFLGSFAAFLAPLVDPDRAEAVVDRFLGHLRTRSSGAPGLLELTLFPGDGPLHEILHAVAGRRGIPIVERYRFERAVAHLGHRENWREGLSASRRKSLARQTRRLSRELGELETEDCGPDAEAFEELVALEAAGWKGERGRGYALALNPDKLAWYRQMADEFRRRHQLHVLRVRAGDRTVYMSLSFRVGDRLFSTIDAYDETVAHLRPGNVGRAVELDHFQSWPEPVTMDPCMHPRYQESSSNYPDRTSLVGLLLAPRGAHNQAALRAVPMVRRGRDMLARGARDTAETAGGTSERS